MFLGGIVSVCDKNPDQISNSTCRSFFNQNELLFNNHTKPLTVKSKDLCRIDSSF